MNCSNLAIVFGPNLLGGDIDGNNAVGTKIVETLLKNAPRLFGCPVLTNNGYSGSSNGADGQLSISRGLTVDTTASSRPARSMDRLESSSNTPWCSSPRGRPKERAPPPPYMQPKAGSLIDLSDECNDAECNDTESTSHISTSALNVSSLIQSQSLMSADLNDSFGMSCTAAQESDDSLDEYQDESLPNSISKSEGESITTSFAVPQRPPPPALRPESSNSSRPLSYNKAVGAEPTPVPRTRPSRSVAVENSSSPSGYGPIKRPTILNRENLAGENLLNSFKTVVSVDAPSLPARAKPPLPTKPRSGENETSRL